MPFQDQKLMGNISQKSMLLRLLHILAHTGVEIFIGVFLMIVYPNCYKSALLHFLRYQR
jgi:hypothetical protein